MNLLKEFNSNTYIKICSVLNNDLAQINSFISKIRQEGNYSKVLELEEFYIKTFSNPILIDYIETKIERVLNPHYNIYDNIKPKAGNSTFFISIKLKSETLIKVDILYNKILSSLLRFFKNIFSIIDKPSHTIHNDYLLKYDKLIMDVNRKTKQFLLTSYNKKLIEKRKKLKSNIINNLPHKGFYHITHFDNLQSILICGLLSHAHVYDKKLLKVDISNPKIQNERNRLESVFGRNILEYVPLYINPKNPMMASQKLIKHGSNIILLEIIPHILVQVKNTLFSDGNAAQMQTNFYNNQLEMENLNWQLLQKGQWVNETDSQRIMCSEVLVPEIVETAYINRIILKDNFILEKIMLLFPNHKGIEVEINEEFFLT